MSNRSKSQKSFHALLQAAQDALGHGGPCVLCGERSTHMGDFFYTEKFAVRIGRKSKGVAFYRVCVGCLNSPHECAIRVEEKMIADYEASQRSNEGQVSTSWVPKK